MVHLKSGAENACGETACVRGAVRVRNMCALTSHSRGQVANRLQPGSEPWPTGSGLMSYNISIHSYAADMVAVSLTSIVLKRALHTFYFFEIMRT